MIIAQPIVGMAKVCQSDWQKPCNVTG